MSSTKEDLMTDFDKPDELGREARAALGEALHEIKRVIVGQDAMLERLLVSLLAGGHVLLEGVPGLAKTLTVKTLAAVLGGSYNRIQFTPDLVPADLVGTRVCRRGSGGRGTEPPRAGGRARAPGARRPAALRGGGRDGAGRPGDDRLCSRARRRHPPSGGLRVGRYRAADRVRCQPARADRSGRSGARAGAVARAGSRVACGRA